MGDVKVDTLNVAVDQDFTITAYEQAPEPYVVNVYEDKQLYLQGSGGLSFDSHNQETFEGIFQPHAKPPIIPPGYVEPSTLFDLRMTTFPDGFPKSQAPIAPFKQSILSDAAKTEGEANVENHIDLEAAHDQVNIDKRNQKILAKHHYPLPHKAKHLKKSKKAKKKMPPKSKVQTKPHDTGRKSLSVSFAARNPDVARPKKVKPSARITSVEDIK
jgi:hypothetical protein